MAPLDKVQDNSEASPTHLDTSNLTQEEGTRAPESQKSHDFDTASPGLTALEHAPDDHGNESDNSSAATEILVRLDGREWSVKNSTDCPIFTEISRRQAEDAQMKALTDSASKILQAGRAAFRAVEEARDEAEILKAFEKENVLQGLLNETWAGGRRFKRDARERRGKWRTEHQSMYAGVSKAASSSQGRPEVG